MYDLTSSSEVRDTVELWATGGLHLVGSVLTRVSSALGQYVIHLVGSVLTRVSSALAPSPALYVHRL
jgi:hypothetical protein